MHSVKALQRGAKGDSSPAATVRYRSGCVETKKVHQEEGLTTAIAVSQTPMMTMMRRLDQKLSRRGPQAIESLSCTDPRDFKLILSERRSSSAFPTLAKSGRCRVNASINFEDSPRRTLCQRKTFSCFGKVPSGIGRAQPCLDLTCLMTICWSK